MSKANGIQVGGNHYAGGKSQHWDVATDLQLRGIEYAATKYLSRFGNKVGEPARKDLLKVQHYIAKLIEVFDEGRTKPLSEVQASYGLTIQKIDAILAPFLDALTGPPADDINKRIIVRLCTWGTRAELEEAQQFMSVLIHKHSNTSENNLIYSKD